MTNTKAFGISHINKQAKEINKMSRYYSSIDNGETHIDYYPFFSNSKIDELLTELIMSTNECKEKGLDYLRNDEEIIMYAYFLIIKHFTALKKQLDKKTIEFHFTVLNNLYDKGYYEEFINEMFDENEVQKVIDKMHNLEEFALRNEQRLLEKVKVIKDNTTNKHLQEKLINNIN